MALLLGTHDGLYRTDDVLFDQAERVLKGRSTAYRFGSTLLARSEGDLYESDDAGRSWSAVETPEGHVSALHRSGDRLYAGVQTAPPSLHVSVDGSRDWQEIAAFPDLPALAHYVPQQDAMEPTPQDVGFACIRSPPRVPGRLIVGFDPAGVRVSDDGGESWNDRSYGLSADVHGLAVCTPTQYVAACWSGLYRTGDAGRSWSQLVTDQGLLRYDYFHPVAVQDGSIHTAAAASPPGRWGGDLGIDAILLESHDFGESFEQVPYPGGPDEFVFSLASVDGRLVGGTMADTWDGREVATGRVIVREDGEWTTAGRVPAGVTSITAI